jgi:hypothetical protein
VSESASDAKRRGVGFPSMGLQDAVDAVVLAGQNGPTHTQDAFATYLGHKTANSGAFRGKLASLRDWGLIARGDRDRVTLSSLAQELVLASPEQPKQLLLTAFESCRVFGMFHGDSAKNVPMDLGRLRTQALMRFGVARNQADKFVDSFVKSAVFAGLAETDGATVTLFPRDTAFSASDEGDDEARGAEVSPSHAAPTGTNGGVQPTPASVAQAVSAPAVPVALRQQWPIDGGEIEFVIRTSEALPPSLYALVAEMAEVAEKMKIKLSGPAFEITTDNPPAAYKTAEPSGD